MHVVRREINIVLRPNYRTTEIKDVNGQMFLLDKEA